jgi:hypothetical protein
MSVKGKEGTVTVFRAWDDGSIIALFPEVRADVSGKHCQSYQHIGQHGAADYAYVLDLTRPARPAELAELAEELTEIGYTLRIVSEASHYPQCNVTQEKRQ